MGTAAFRTDRASRIIHALRSSIYAALVNAEATRCWLPPGEMECEVHQFDPRPGGTYHLSLTYQASDAAPRGKSSERRDVVRGRFVELLSDERVVQAVSFDSDDPAFAQPMTITWTLTDTSGGTEVTIQAEGVPEAIRPEDHAAGMNSTLAKLAAYTE